MVQLRMNPMSVFPEPLFQLCPASVSLCITLISWDVKSSDLWRQQQLIYDGTVSVLKIHNDTTLHRLNIISLSYTFKLVCVYAAIIKRD